MPTSHVEDLQGSQNAQDNYLLYQFALETGLRAKVDFHSLRHTFGTLLASSGVHPKIAQELMRHSNINLTMNIYTHTQSSQVEAAVNNLRDFQAKNNGNERQAS